MILKKYPNFSKLYFAGLVSELGSFISDTAVMLYVFQATNENKFYIGLSRALFLLFLTLGSLLGGALGANYNRKKILIASNLLRIPLVASLLYHNEVTYVICVNALVAFFTGIFNPSRQTLINELVPSHDIKKANSLFGSTLAILHLVGPLIGAYLFSYTQRLTEVVLLDLLTYIIGLLTLMTLHYTLTHDHRDHRPGVFDELLDGFRFTKKREDLMALFSYVFLASLCIGVLIPLLIPYIKQVLGQPDEAYGEILAVFGIGGIIGGNISQKISRTIATGKMIVYAFCLEALFMLIWLISNSYWGSLCVFFIWGIIVFIRISSQLNYISQSVETHYLSRVHSLLDLAFVVPNIIGGILVAAMGDNISTLEFLWGLSGIFVLFTFGRLGSQGVRKIMAKTFDEVEREIQA